MVRRLSLIGAVVAATVAMVLPQSVVAQDSGVTVDPNSAAGKEYAIPVERARKDAGLDGSRSSATSTGPASGQESEGGESSSSPELFGEGIMPQSSSKPGKPGPKGADGDSGSADQGSPDSNPAQRSTLQAAPSAFATPAPSSNAFPWLLGGAGIVVLAALGGRFARRR